MILYALIVVAVLSYLALWIFQPLDGPTDPSQNRDSQNREYQNRESQFVADEHGAAGGWDAAIRPGAIGRVETVHSSSPFPQPRIVREGEPGYARSASEREAYEAALREGRAAQAHWEADAALNPPRYERVSPTEIRRIPDEPKR